MKMLFTGGSSFTGYWFISELKKAGHEVVATFRGTPEKYDGVRKERVDRLLPLCRPVFECSFGSESFIKLIEEENWDLLSHHAADVTDYKSPDFDVPEALKNNTLNLPTVLKALKQKGCGRVLLTGSVFEQDEGTGSEGLRAFSPYGLSKGLTAEVFRYHTGMAGIKLAKFVIPNPFGPYEEPRFTAYLIRSWYEGKTPTVSTPAYVRDNIHVSLLAKAYAHYTGTLKEDASFEKLNPSGYIETQGAFAERFADEMRKRLSIPCELKLAEQTEFPEPRERVNTDVPDHHLLGWDETKAWDELAEYYRSVYG
jgi:nucleoside-diphosphate-sugar epimerase